MQQQLPLWVEFRVFGLELLLLQLTVHELPNTAPTVRLPVIVLT
jgi:hypothetical protein